MARLRGPRLRAFLQDLGAVARGEHTVDMLQTYVGWKKVATRSCGKAEGWTGELVLLDDFSVFGLVQDGQLNN